MVRIMAIHFLILIGLPGLIRLDILGLLDIGRSVLMTRFTPQAQQQ